MTLVLETIPRFREPVAVFSDLVGNVWFPGMEDI